MSHIDTHTIKYMINYIMAVEDVRNVMYVDQYFSIEKNVIQIECANQNDLDSTV